MADDLYTEWLSIPPGERPPDHYALLEIDTFCGDLDQVESAARERMDALDKYALHPDRGKREAVQRMMNEVARARVCLVNARRKRDYDMALADELGIAPPGEPLLQAEAVPAVVTVLSEADAIGLFMRTVREHLLKWRLNPHEEMLLLAEAESLGVKPDAARIIIRQTDAEAESIAAARRRRWQVILAGGAGACIVAIILSVAIPALIKGHRRQRFLSHLSAAGKHAEAEEFGKAVEELVEAGLLFPQDDELDRVRREVVDRLAPAADQHITAGDAARAKQVLAAARKLPAGRARLGRLYQRLNDLEARLRREGAAPILADLRKDLQAERYAQARERLEILRRNGLETAPAESLIDTHHRSILTKLRLSLSWQKWTDAAAAEENARQLKPQDPTAAELVDGTVPLLVSSGSEALALKDYVQANRLAYGALALRPDDPAARALSRKIAELSGEAPPRRPPPRPAGGKVASAWANAKTGATLTYNSGSSLQEVLRVVHVTAESVIVRVTAVQYGRRRDLGEVSFPRFVSASADKRRRARRKKVGTETLTVGGRSLLCDVYQEDQLKTWLCDKVPGGLVRRQLARSPTSAPTLLELTEIRQAPGPPPPAPPTRRPDISSRYTSDSARRAAARYRAVSMLMSRSTVPWRGTSVTRDQARVLTAGGGLVRIWDAASGKLERVVRTGDARADRLVLDEDGSRFLAFGRGGRAIGAWDVATGKQVLSVSLPKGRFCYAAALYSGGSKALVAASDAVLLYSIPGGEREPVKLAGKLPTAISCSVEQMGSRAVILLGDGTARVFDLDRRRLLHELKQREAPLVLARFSTRGRLIHTLDADRAGAIWNAATGRRLSRIAEIDARATGFSPDGTRLLMLSDDDELALYDTGTGAEIAVLGEAVLTSWRRREPYVRRAVWGVFSPDSRAIVSTTYKRPSAPAAPVAPPGRRPGRVLPPRRQPTPIPVAAMWDARTGRKIADLTRLRTGPPYFRLLGSGDKALIVGRTYCYLQDVRTGRTLTRFAPYLRGVSTTIFGPKGDTVLTLSGGQARLWKIDTGAELARISSSVSGKLPSSAAAGLAALRSSSGQLALLDLTTGKQRPLEGKPGRGNLLFSSSGRLLLLTGGSLTKAPPVWDTTTGKLRKLSPAAEAVTDFVFSPDERHLAGRAPGRTYIWDMRSGTNKPLLVPKGAGSPTTLLFTPDSKRLLGSGRGAIIVWDIADGKGRLLSVPGGGRRYSGGCRPSPDGKLILAGSTRGALLLWDAATGKRTDPGKPSGVYFLSDIAFGLGGKVILAKGSGKALMYDVSAGKWSNLTTPKGTSYLASLKVSPDGKFAAGHDYRNLILWDLATREMRLIGRPGSLRFRPHIRFAPDGKLLVIQSSQETLAIDPPTGKKISHISHPVSLKAGEWFSPDVRRFALLARDGTIRIYDVTTGAQVGRLIGDELKRLLPASR